MGSEHNAFDHGDFDTVASERAVAVKQADWDFAGDIWEAVGDGCGLDHIADLSQKFRIASEAAAIERAWEPEREHIAKLHRLQHDDARNSAEPVWGGSVIAWAAEEIAAIRTSITRTGE